MQSLFFTLIPTSASRNHEVSTGADLATYACSQVETRPTNYVLSFKPEWTLKETTATFQSE
jgi:hypothetical protein